MGAEPHANWARDPAQLPVGLACADPAGANFLAFTLFVVGVPGTAP